MQRQYVSQSTRNMLKIKTYMLHFYKFNKEMQIKRNFMFTRNAIEISFN